MANRDYRQIAMEILAEADRIDPEEDELYGDARGDELPEPLRTAEGRKAACGRPSASSTVSRPASARGPGPECLQRGRPASVTDRTEWIALPGLLRGQHQPEGV